MATPINEPFSPYAKFHLTYLGFSFIDKLTNKKLRKFDVWHNPNLRTLAIAMTATRKTAARFELINSPGWENGKLLKQLT